MFSEQNKEPGALKHIAWETWLPILVFVAIMIRSVWMWNYSVHRDAELLRKEADIMTRQSAMRLSMWVNTRIDAALLLLPSAPLTPTPVEDDFRRHFTPLLQEYSGIQAINWVDANGRIRVVNPPISNQAALGKNLHEHPSASVSVAIRKAEMTGSPTRSDVLNLLQGGQGIGTYLPVLSSNGQPKGFLNMVFRIDDMLEECFPESETHDSFTIVLREDSKTFYSTRPGPHPEVDSSFGFNLLGKHWTLSAIPSDFREHHEYHSMQAWQVFINVIIATVSAMAIRMLLMRNKELAREKDLVEALIRDVPEGIFFKDRQHRLLRLNGAMARILGIDDPKEAIGKKDSAFLSGDYVSDSFADEETVFLEEKSVQRKEDWALQKDGSKIWIASTTVPHHDSSGKVIGTIGIARDVTDDKEREKEKEALKRQMFANQKNESLGLMAGHVAHDFNNFLTAIIGNAELGMIDLDRNSRTLPFFLEILSAARSSKTLCSQLLSYSGGKVFKLTTLDLNDVIRNTRSMFQAAVSKRIEIQVELTPHLPGIKGNENQIQQVLINLISNAAQAMKANNGLIHIRTGTETLTRELIHQYQGSKDMQPGLSVYVEVEDNGIGMDSRTIQRIFDPFFTTKEEGHGLGMASTLGIVRSHSAGIRVSSSPGKGSRFRISFQPSGDEIEPIVELPKTPSKDGSNRWSGTVLLVDDEESLLKTGSKILERFGFNVMVAMDGYEAIEIIKSNPGLFDLIFLDLAMPHMDGETTFNHIRKLDPNVRIIICSGAFSGGIIDRLSQLDVTATVSKPFGIEELRLKLVEVFT